MVKGGPGLCTKLVSTQINYALRNPHNKLYEGRRVCMENAAACTVRSPRRAMAPRGSDNQSGTTYAAYVE